MNILKNWLIFLLNFISFVTFAQIQITFPVSRIVFQRNNQNQASVNIAGSYFQQLDMSIPDVQNKIYPYLLREKK
jgi:hypothetical protein